jgi:hypothetical protein
MVLVMSMAVERGLLPAAVMAATRGDVRFELGRGAPVWCAPSLASAPPPHALASPLDASLDALAVTTVAVLRGDPAAHAAAAATLAAVLRGARAEALDVVGLRYGEAASPAAPACRGKNRSTCAAAASRSPQRNSEELAGKWPLQSEATRSTTWWRMLTLGVWLGAVWLTGEQASQLARRSTHRPDAAGGAVMAVALRGRDAVRRTLSLSVSTSQSTSSALTASTSAASAAHDVAWLFGGRVAAAAAVPWAEAAGAAAMMVAPSAVERAWAMLPPAAPVEHTRAAMAALGAAGLQLVSVTRASLDPTAQVSPPSSHCECANHTLRFRSSYHHTSHSVPRLVREGDANLQRGLVCSAFLLSRPCPAS